MLAADVGARALFLLWTDPRAISADLRGWQQVADALVAGQNPYNTTPALNWPPLWMQVLFGISRLASTVGVPLVRAIPVFLIASELALILAADRLLALFQVPRRRLLLLLGIAWNPICLLLVCQHGNFDVLIALSITLFWIWLLRFHRDEDWSAWLMAALWLGLGVTLKGAPAVLSPARCSSTALFRDGSA